MRWIPAAAIGLVASAACSSPDTTARLDDRRPDAEASVTKSTCGALSPSSAPACRDPCGGLTLQCRDGAWRCEATGPVCPDAFTPHPQGGACGVTDVTGSLPGVSISIRADGCTFAIGQGGAFSFTITVAEPAPSLTFPAEPGPCGSCGTPTGNPLSSAFVGFGEGDHRYNAAIGGDCCAPHTSPRTVTLEPGIVSSSFFWPGHEGNTAHPLGDAFPPGDYAFQVAVYDSGGGRSVVATLPIHVVAQ